jgi:hypothetical protein
VYSLDERGARVTPDTPTSMTCKDVVFFGCSVTFGTGVNDDETLPNFVARRTPKLNVSNFGIGGYGPAHMLRAIETEGVMDHFCGCDSHVIYVYIPHHVRRVIGGMRTSIGFGRNFPLYKLLADGELEYRGTMESGRPFLHPLYTVLVRESVLKHFEIDLPVRITRRHLELTAAIIAESRDAWFARNPHSEFTVVIYPEPLWAETPAEEIVPLLTDKGIRVLDYSNRFEGDSSMWIPHDLHPTAQAHDRVAQWIVEDLGLNQNTTTD